ncbi:MAG: SDR family NAD(P)-dependent oxidoreductase [Alphaproteobacteria bacterium]|jgi:short-subunit dehydrogenase|nr:SDR family NAD(P)-dependent oxidoreductase [Alphaproteobacteria bacterium]
MDKQTILITGASSGLGYELALQYSKPHIRLILVGRNLDQLNKIANLCSIRGAETYLLALDIREKKALNKHLTNFSTQYGIDVVIACAGVSAGTLQGPESPSQVETIFETNINGVLNTIMPIIPHMITRKKGNITIISSMAGLIGLSSAPSYSASKACIRVFGEALRGYLKQYNVHTTVVIPGYIKTPMTDVNNFPMPFMISVEKAAEKIIKGISNNKEVIVFPITIYLLLKFLSFLPNQLIDYINSKLPGKPAFENKKLKKRD